MQRASVLTIFVAPCMTRCSHVLPQQGHANVQDATYQCCIAFQEPLAPGTRNRRSRVVADVICTLEAGSRQAQCRVS